MRIHVLGSGGWIPTDESDTSCYLIEEGDTLIFLDAGSGMRNLAKHQAILGKHREIHIIFSHYHLDHLIGLIYMIPYIRTKRLFFYGPGDSFYEGGVEKVLNDLTQAVFFPRNIHNFSEHVHFIDYDLSGMNISGIRLEVTGQNHSAPSFGITVGNTVHYATDTTMTDQTIHAAKKAPLLLHECWGLHGEIGKTHSSLEEIIHISKELYPTRIGLIHKNPFWTKQDYDYIGDRINGLPIFIVHDGDELQVG